MKIKALVDSGRSTKKKEIKVEEYIIMMDTSTGRVRMDGLAC